MSVCKYIASRAFPISTGTSGYGMRSEDHQSVDRDDAAGFDSWTAQAQADSAGDCR